MAEPTVQQLDGGTRKQIVDKLNKLLIERFDLYPSYNDPDHDDAMRVEIDRWYEKIKTTFDSFGISSAREKVESTYKNLQDQGKLLFVVQLPSRHEGEYLIVVELSDLLEAYIFAYGTSDSGLPESASLQQNEYELMETKEAFTNLVVKDELSATPFLSDVDISNAYKMAELYIILHCYENSVRQLVEKVLVQNLGDNWWEQVASTKMKRDVEQLQENEKKRKWLSVRGKASPLYYLQWGDLVKLIRKHEDLFKPHIGELRFVENRFGDLENLRHIVAHHGVLPSEDDFQRVIISFRDWCLQIGRK